MWAQILSGRCSIQFRRIDVERRKYYSKLFFDNENLSKFDFEEKLINEIKEKVPKLKQQWTLRHLGLEESFVEKVQKTIKNLVNTAAGNPKDQPGSKKEKSSKNKPEKRVTRGSLRQDLETDDVKNDGEDDEEDEDEDKRKKKKVAPPAPVSDDTSSETSGPDVESEDEELDGKFVTRRFGHTIFVHESIQKPRTKKEYWCSTDRSFRIKGSSNFPPNDGFEWKINQHFAKKKGSAPIRKLIKNTGRINKFYKYTWGNHQIEKKFVANCSVEGCKAKKITTKPERYKGNTFLYKTIYKRLHNHESDLQATEFVSKRNRESSDSIEGQRQKKREKISQGTSKRPILSSSSKAEDSSQKKQKKALKQRASKRRKVAKQLFDTSKEKNSNKEAKSDEPIESLSDSFRIGFKDIGDKSSSREKSQTTISKKEENSSDSLSENLGKVLKVSEESSAKETTFSPVDQEKKTKKKKKESKIDRLRKRFKDVYKKDDPTLFDSETSSSDSSNQKKAEKLRVSDVFTESKTSSEDSSGKTSMSLPNPTHKSTPIQSNVETDEDSKDTVETRSNVEEKKERKEKGQEKNTETGQKEVLEPLSQESLGPSTQRELFEPWSQAPIYESSKLTENEVEVEQRRGGNEESLNKNAGIGPSTQKELLEPWSQDPNYESSKLTENEVHSSLPGRPQHKSTPINSSEITVSSVKQTEDQSSQGLSKQSPPSEKNTTLIEDAGEPTSQVIKNNKKHEFHYQSQAKSKDFSQQKTSIEKEEENAKTKSLAFVDDKNENSQFDLSPPSLSDVEYDQPNQTENQPELIKNQSMRVKSSKIQIQNQAMAKRLADLSISDEAYQKYRIEVGKIRENDDDLAVKAYKCLSKKIQLYKEPWKMDALTPTNDECFFHAIIQQAKREEVQRNIPSSILKALLEEGNSLKLRLHIINEMESNSENEELVKLRNNNTELQSDENLIRATAFLLGMDIVITDMNSDPEYPTIIHKNTVDDTLDGLPDPFLVLGKILISFLWRFYIYQKN